MKKILCIIAVMALGCQSTSRKEAFYERRLRYLFKNHIGVYSDEAKEMFKCKFNVRSIVKRLSKEGGEIGFEANYFLKKYYPDKTVDDSAFPWKPTKAKNLEEAVRMALRPVEKLHPSGPKKIKMETTKNQAGTKALVIVVYSEGALAGFKYALFFILRDNMWLLAYGDSYGGT